MSYEGEVFTYRASPVERSPRLAASPHSLRAPANDRVTAWERLARAEGALAALAERVEQLGSMLRELTEAAEAGKARVHGGRPAVPDLPQAVSEPPEAPQDVKVSFFADGTTKAVMGTARVIQQ